MTDSDPDDGATRHVGNCSDGPIFIAGYGVLPPDTERAGADGARPEPVEVPDGPAVRQLLALHALWTHEPAEPADADPASDENETTTDQAPAQPAAKRQARRSTAAGEE